MKKSQTEGILEIKIWECTLKLVRGGLLREYRDGKQFLSTEDTIEGMDTLAKIC